MKPTEYPISSPYGIRTINGNKSFHYGVDFATPSGTVLESLSNGQVVHSAYDSMKGNCIIVKDYSTGYYWHYLHLTYRKVKNGDTVKAGDILGSTGSTGNSTGPHLHLEVSKSFSVGYKDYAPEGHINPLDLLNKPQEQEQKKGHSMGIRIIKTNTAGDGQEHYLRILEDTSGVIAVEVNEPQAINEAWEYGIEIKQHGNWEDFYQGVWRSLGFVVDWDWNRKDEIGNHLFDQHKDIVGKRA